MAVKAQTPDSTSTDRIEKRVVLRAPRTRVWRALTNAAEFGTWFRVKLEGAFTEGRPIQGRMAIPGYEHVTVEMLVERIDPERYFAYRWHPYAVDPAVDYSAEPTASRRSVPHERQRLDWADQAPREVCRVRAAPRRCSPR